MVLGRQRTPEVAGDEMRLKTHWTGIVQVGIGVNATSSKIAVTRGHVQTAATEI